MAYIYKITNKINGKVYIGKTLNSIQKRWREHLIDSKKRRCEKRPLYSAINKYGEENFEIEQIEECSYDILNERECYWIEYFGSFKNGYNATVGGDGRPYLDYDLIYNTYIKINSISKTAELCQCSKDSVIKILKNKGLTTQDFIKNSSKTVAMLDKNTEEILKIFPSAREASKFLNKTPQHIRDVCLGKRKSAYGYKWSYL